MEAGLCKAPQTAWEWIVSAAFFPQAANFKEFVLRGGGTAGYAALNETTNSRFFLRDGV